MRSDKLSLVLALSLLTVTILFVRERSANPRATDRDQAFSSPTSAAFHQLLELDWETGLKHNPTWASTLGDRRWNTEWPDLSARALAAADAHNTTMLEKLAQIDQEALPPDDQLNYELYKHSKEQASEEFDHQWHFIALNQRGGIQTEDQLGDSLRFETLQDYEDWIARLNNFRPYARQTKDLLQGGIDSGILLPKITMQRVPPQLEKQIVDHPDESPFYAPLLNIPDSIPPADRKRLREEARAAISQTVVPAYRELLDFFLTSYLPACPDKPGIWNLPDGGELYAFFARKYTTTSLTPDEIHQIGLDEVSRIRGEMELVRQQVGFSGDLPAFFEHLRTDPQFYYHSPAELMAGFRAISKRIDPLMVQVFATLPRIPYGVQAIPAAIAPDTTSAYYRRPAADGSRAGAFFVNTFRPETRPKWGMMALSLHEAVPGHHLQIARAMELDNLPDFRRYSGYTAYIEGWGLYSEFLGEELGLYEDPYDKFGQLTYEMWRSIRLVVDTGIHHKRWTRQEAINYFIANTPRSKLDITNEIDRYISWPGQALAYKIGELKLKELRKRATSALGEEFDIKAFHEVVLRQGAVPLHILEQSVDEWIASTST